MDSISFFIRQVGIVHLKGYSCHTAQRLVDVFDLFQ